VHIGGGEPFLDFDGLLSLISEVHRAGIGLEYIETNAYWIEEEAQTKLERLLEAGGTTLCISIDPFHAEYVPYSYPLRLQDLCEQTGMKYFLWQSRFIPALTNLDPLKTHTWAELGNRGEIAQRYGIHWGGRAVNIEEEYAPRGNIILDASPCSGLLSTGPFHADLLGNFIPPGCTGLRLPLAEAVEGVSAGKYPVFGALYFRGIRGLLDLAGDFVPAPGGYPSKCNLCFHLRRHLADQGFPELDKEYYEAALAYW
jgi:hypothetical protein